jgi:hypothetical protein
MIGSHLYAKAMPTHFVYELGLSKIDSPLIALHKAIGPSPTQKLGVKPNAHWCQQKPRNLLSVG